MMEENMLRGSLTSTQEAKGSLGFKGDRGYSAYEIAVQNGYEGTEQDWIDHFGLDLTDYIKTSDIIDDRIHGGSTKVSSASVTLAISNELITAQSDILQIDGNVGDLSSLTTSTKTDLVSAINEVNSRDIYSTTERVIGTWINGKPLYRKVVSFGTLPNNNTKTVAHNISNIGIVTSIKGIGINTISHLYYVIPATSVDALGNQIQIYCDNTDIYIKTGIDRSSITESYIILEYTKTTD